MKAQEKCECPPMPKLQQLTAFLWLKEALEKIPVELFIFGMNRMLFKTRFYSLKICIMKIFRQDSLEL